MLVCESRLYSFDSDKGIKYQFFQTVMDSANRGPYIPHESSTGSANLLARKTTENGGNDLVYGLLVPFLELTCVLVFDGLSTKTTAIEISEQHKNSIWGEIIEIHTHQVAIPFLLLRLEKSS